MRKILSTHSSATKGYIANVVDCYPPGAKTEILIVHVGHNSIGKSASKPEAATKQSANVTSSCCYMRNLSGKRWLLWKTKQTTRKYLTSMIIWKKQACSLMVLKLGH